MSIQRVPVPCNETRQPAIVAGQRLTDHDPSNRRQLVDIAASVRVSGDELAVQHCQLRSLSLGGAFLDLGRLPMGTLVNITFALPTVSERLSLDAIVQWCAEDGVSVLFDSLRASEVYILWRYLASGFDAERFEPTKRISVAKLAAKP